MDKNIYYAVHNESCLGLVYTSSLGLRMLLILHASVLRGCPFSPMSGSVMADEKEIRYATPQDFTDFRVCLPADFYTINPNH